MQLLTSHDYISAEEQLDEGGHSREQTSCEDGFMAELLAGLSRTDRAVPCRFLYDQAGSALFDQICEIPEYYPTRTECGILKAHACEIAAAIGNEVRFVELGAGSGGKAEILLDQMPGARSHVCTNISPVPLGGTEARHIEMTLVSTAEQDVRVGGRTFAFAKGETIHVENSHKYAVAEFANLAADAGFDVSKVWTDKAGLFSVQLLTTRT